MRAQTLEEARNKQKAVRHKMWGTPERNDKTTSAYSTPCMQCNNTITSENLRGVSQYRLREAYEKSQLSGLVNLIKLI